MNELEFHNRLLQDPHTLDEPMLAYLKAHPEQQQNLKKARELDQKISGALKVEAPEGLVERILLKQSYQESAEQTEPGVDASVEHTAASPEKVIRLNTHQSKSPESLISRATSRWQSWQYALVGMAASVLVAVLFSGLWQNPQHSHQALTGEDMVAHIIEHVEHDPDLMKPQSLALSESELNQLFAKVGATLQQPVDFMSYAGECDVEGQKGLHIVMQDERGPVTIIVMPGHQIDAMIAFNKSGYTGELVPVKGGLVAVVGSTASQLTLAQSRFFKAVKFG